MTRDRITVEREYDGERCGYECEHLSTIDEPHCDHFRQSLESEQDGSPDEGGDILYYRCPSCLSTPGLLEPQDAEVREAVEHGPGLADAMEISGYKTVAQTLRTLLRAVQAPRLTGER